MNLFFTFDEWSDVSTAPETRVQADVIMDALRNPYKTRPSNEWVGGEVARQYVHLLSLYPSADVAAGFGLTPSRLPLRLPRGGSSMPSSSIQILWCNNRSTAAKAFFETSKTISSSDATQLALSPHLRSTKSIWTYPIMSLKARSLLV